MADIYQPRTPERLVEILRAKDSVDGQNKMSKKSEPEFLVTSGGQSTNWLQTSFVSAVCPHGVHITVCKVVSLVDGSTKMEESLDCKQCEEEYTEKLRALVADMRAAVNARR